MDLQVGDILACKSNTLLGKIIKLFTRSIYSHTSIVYDIVDGEPVFVGEINYTYSYAIRKIAYDDYDVYRYKGEIDKKAIQNEILKMIGVKYDFLDILRIVFCMPMKYTPSRLICSEAIDEIYKNCGYGLNIETECPTPEELIKSSRLKRVQ